MTQSPKIRRFLSTPSARRATDRKQPRVEIEIISIHALREEGDRPTPSGTNWIPNFYPRPPRGGRLRVPNVFVELAKFLSTPSARRATFLTNGTNRATAISIHALREEGDDVSSVSAIGKFDFYPRPPRGGRRKVRILPQIAGDISIHALREEGDRLRGMLPTLLTLFLSTPSARRATQEASVPGGRPSISIHALREEGDSHRRSARSRCRNFYPRPPRGGRHSCRVCPAR